MEIFLNNNSEENLLSIQKLGPGRVFGDLNFINGLEYEFTAKSTSFVTLQSLSRKDFLKIIQKSKDEYEKFIFI